MNKFVKDVKDQKYESTEYIFDDGSDVKAIECIPISAVGGKQRSRIENLDDLNVQSSIEIVS
jgi:hypothetical protein